MTNILNKVNSYILTNVLEGSGIEAIYNDTFPEAEGPLLMSRHDPSSKALSFIDGTSTGTLMVAYYMRSADALTCRTVLNEIAEKMDEVHISAEGLELDIETNTLPNFTMIDDKENTIYSCELSINYIM